MNRISFGLDDRFKRRCKAQTASLLPLPLWLLPGRSIKFPGGTCTHCETTPRHGARKYELHGIDVSAVVAHHVNTLGDFEKAAEKLSSPQKRELISFWMAC